MMLEILKARRAALVDLGIENEDNKEGDRGSEVDAEDLCHCRHTLSSYPVGPLLEALSSYLSS